MTCNSIVADDVKTMETCILKAIEFNLTFPSSLSFLETFMKAI